MGERKISSRNIPRWLSGPLSPEAGCVANFSFLEGSSSELAMILTLKGHCQCLDTKLE